MNEEKNVHQARMIGNSEFQSLSYFIWDLRRHPRSRSQTLTTSVPTTWRWPALWVSKDYGSTRQSSPCSCSLQDLDTQSPGSLLKPTAAHMSSEFLSTYVQEKTPKNKPYKTEQRPWVFFHLTWEAHSMLLPCQPKKTCAVRLTHALLSLLLKAYSNYQSSKTTTQGLLSGKVTLENSHGRG